MTEGRAREGPRRRGPRRSERGGDGARGERLWRGRRVLVTAGPTREYLDPVRFLTNASSGAMGFALARAARGLGARVTVVCGPTAGTGRLTGVRVVPVVTAEDMRRRVLAASGRTDVLIAAAAVGDWRFGRAATEKLKKTRRPLRVTLMPNPDIVAEVARGLGRASGARLASGRTPRGSRPRRTSSARPRVLVGFALETHRMEERAAGKLRRKGLDVIVANGPDSIGSDRIRFSILDRSGGLFRFSRRSKGRAAGVILRHVERFL